MNDFANQDGRALIDAMVQTIHENAAYLSQLDGAIGDGDHGINMNKGFTLTATRLAGAKGNLSAGLSTLAEVLLGEIGGAMGPLYGTFFGEMAKVSSDHERIEAAVFSNMLNAALEAVQELGGAQVGDKTLVDTLHPAVAAFDQSLSKDPSFAKALEAASMAAEKGKEDAKALVAKLGRASRLGERSRGVLDAGSVSCWLLLKAMAESSQKLLKADQV
jgi:dihydroxyacetone kinase-like protein